MQASLKDPLETLDQIAARQSASETAARSISAARARLILGRDAKSVFFAALSLRLKPVQDWESPTMATDGKSLLYNPAFVNGLTMDELIGTIVHEAMHLGMAHHCRRGDRDPKKWNTACDCAINPLLLDAGFILPQGRLMPGEGSYTDLPRGKSAEEYYSLLPEPSEEEGADPGGCGEIRDPSDGSPSAIADQQAEWLAATAQAENVARSRGPMPDGLARMVDQSLRPAADWRNVLREFISSNARNDYSWARPNRRFIAEGLYLPGLQSEELGDVVIAIDTSGSIGPEELSAFSTEVNTVLESFDCTATIIYHDSEVQKVDEWRSSDGPLTLEPIGGGGTSHVCVFDWLEKSGLSPSCVVCLTDLYTEFSATPDMPVLWAIVGGNEAVPPFGRVVVLDC